MKTENAARRWRLRFAACAALLFAGAASAAENTALDAYLQGLSTWSADFSQKVEDSAGAEIEADAATGQLTIVRPGRFRWEATPEGYDAPSQLMIADGRNLWFLDYDLEQATVRAQQEAGQQSPLMLLTSGADLRGAFRVSADGRRNGLEWVKVTPLGAQSDFREALFGFRGRELARLVIATRLGQRSTLDFRNVRRNAAVDPDSMRFELPEGTDLIGTPVQP